MLAAGDVVGGKYRVDRILGEGGMGQVWAARHAVTGKHVALKILKSEREEDRARLLREARAACAVRHAGVAQVHDITTLDDGSPMLVMDLLEGESLRARLLRDGSLSFEDTCAILSDVLAAVHAAHAIGIVHRDLKPDNVFLCKDGSVKVLDFGIAKLVTAEADPDNAGLTMSGAMLGTPYYMAPEQAFAEKDIDARADLWAIGVMIYECLTGERPTQAANLGQILKIITTRSFRPLGERAPNVPRELAAIVDRCLSLDRADRPSSAEEIKRVLDACKAGAPIVITPRLGQHEDHGAALATTVRAVPSTPKLPEDKPPTAPSRWPLLALGAIAIGAASVMLARTTAKPTPRAPEVSATAPEPHATLPVEAPPVTTTARAPEPTPGPIKTSRTAAAPSAIPSASSSARRVQVVTVPPF